MLGLTASMLASRVSRFPSSPPGPGLLISEGSPRQNLLLKYISAKPNNPLLQQNRSIWFCKREPQSRNLSYQASIYRIRIWGSLSQNQIIQFCSRTGRSGPTKERLKRVSHYMKHLYLGFEYGALFRRTKQSGSAKESPKIKSYIYVLHLIGLNFGALLFRTRSTSSAAELD